MTRGFWVNGSDFLVSVDLVEASGALEKCLGLTGKEGEDILVSHCLLLARF